MSSKIANPLSRRRGVIAGAATGVVALGCCVGPAVAAMLGFASATTAVAVATTLYGAWGWAFKLAGAALAVLVLVAARRRARACSAPTRSFVSFAAVLIGTALATYGVLYAVTTLLGARA
jgi:hypothetical protein